jgi:hypothetical protein
MRAACAVVFMPAVLAMVSFAMPARADAYEDALVRAVAAKEQALDAGDEARWHETLSRFREVNAVRETFETQYEIGFAAEQLADRELAASAYARALELGLTGTGRDHAQAFLAAHEPPPTPAPAPVAPLAPVTAPARPAAAPMPAPARQRGSALPWWLAGGGVVAGGTGAVLVLVAGADISSSRRELSTSCQVPDGVDACRHGRPGRVEDAQRQVDRIATWKGVRTGGWVAVGVGAASLAAGLVLMGRPLEVTATPEVGGARFVAIGAF